MNAAGLQQHFERISEAPDAVPRLRRFILDLAVRGKLVAQDPKDEPASELVSEVIEDGRPRDIPIREGESRRASLSAAPSAPR